MAARLGAATAARPSNVSAAIVLTLGLSLLLAVLGLWLCGQTINLMTLGGLALAVACDGLDPQDDALASAWYRREVAQVHLSRLLLNQEG